MSSIKERCVARLNAECRIVKEKRIAWTPDTLSRGYCNSTQSMCWSCKSILAEYNTPESDALVKLEELFAQQAELKAMLLALDKKLDGLCHSSPMTISLQTPGEDPLVQSQ